MTSITCHADGDKPVFIAHGGGSYLNHSLTNTLEALNANYAKGFRYFELDFSWTSDTKLVAIHDWNYSIKKYYPELKGGIVPSHSEFLNTKMKYGLTQLDVYSVIKWLKDKKDVFLITDIKQENIKALKLLFSIDKNIKDYVIPQVYSYKEYEIAKNIGFKNIILTLYKMKISKNDLLYFADTKKPYAITVYFQIAKNSTIIEDLKNRKITVYTHTVNDIDKFYALKKSGLHGIYTDEIFLDLNSYNKINKINGNLYVK